MPTPQAREAVRRIFHTTWPRDYRRVSAFQHMCLAVEREWLAAGGSYRELPVAWGLRGAS